MRSCKAGLWPSGVGSTGKWPNAEAGFARLCRPGGLHHNCVDMAKRQRAGFAKHRGGLCGRLCSRRPTPGVWPFGRKFRAAGRRPALLNPSASRRLYDRPPACQVERQIDCPKFRRGEFLRLCFRSSPYTTQPLGKGPNAEAGFARLCRPEAYTTYCLVSSRSRWICTSSPTRTPPVSSATFQPRP